MPYNYNPHQHVKIWLSKEPNTFMNLKNQLRLIEMRTINPTDTIYLIYDSGLLSSKALAALIIFCKDHEIIAKDVQTEIFPHCITEQEIRLIRVYRDETTHLDQCGNLAAASDILRWLSPVYTLGTYTDLDVYVDTRNLPQSIPVNKPLLFTVYSDENDNKSYNNDFIAVVDRQAALPYVKKIQQDIYKMCFSALDWSQRLIPEWTSFPLVSSAEKTAREARQEITTNSQNSRFFYLSILSSTTSQFALFSLKKMS